MSRDSTRQLSPSFKVREFACKGSDVVLLDDELVVLLQCIREHFGKPIHITSGYRTAAHNAAGGPLSLTFSRPRPWAAASRASTCWAGRRTSTLRAWTWPRSPPTPRPCCPPGAALDGIRRTPPTRSAAPAGCISIPGRARAGGRCKKTLKLLLLLQYESGPLPEKGRGPFSCSNAPAGGNTGGGVRFMNRRAGGLRV